MYKLVLCAWTYMYMILYLSAVYGLTCTCGNIQEGHAMECQCDTVNNIQWFKGDIRLTTCVGATCLSSPAGYSFSYSGSTYKITISTFSFTNCKGYHFKDIATGEIATFPYCPVLKMTKPANEDQFNILENTSEEFICKMWSDYPAGTVEWYVDSGTQNDLDDDLEITLDITNHSEHSPIDDQEYITTSTLTFSPSKVHDGNNIYCNATNKPEQTPLISQQKPRLNILYGPIVLPMSNQSIEEGKSFVYNCPYTPGNPTDTTVKWIRDADNKEWNSELLGFVNVSKDDSMKYMCTVENTMEPTHQSPVTDPKSGYFYLDVKYKASIEEFVVEDYTGNEVTVEEYTSPILVCKVDSNPTSNIKVLFRNRTLANYPSTLQLKHQLFNVSCDDIGVYMCTGRNYLNGKSLSRQDVVLLVKCQPQPVGNIAYTVHSAEGNPATLRLYSLAYPTVSTVVWTKDGTDLQNNTKLTMSMNHVKFDGSYIDIIQIELLIHNVNASDYGHYTVQIRNDVGMMEKIFILMAEENSDPAGENIGMIVGGVVGGIVFAGLLTLVVVFLLRRHIATSGRERDNNQPNDSNQIEANKPTDDASYNNTEREEPTNPQSNNEATYYNEERGTSYEMLNRNQQDSTTYSSLEPQLGRTDPTKDCSSIEETTYEKCL